MGSSGKFFCLFAIIAACCLAIEARRLGKTRGVRHDVGAPQKQTLFDGGIPFDQTDPATGGSADATGGSDVDDMDVSSESSEESDVDTDMDAAEMDTADANDADAADTPAMIGGNLANLLPILAGRKGTASEANSQLGRTSGSSAKGVGVAFGVLGLLTVVVGAAAYALRKYRHSIPVIVRT